MREKILVIHNKLGNALSYIPMVCVGIRLKLVLRHELLIFDTYHPATGYLRAEGYENPWLFFEAKRGGLQTAKGLGNAAL